MFPSRNDVDRLIFFRRVDKIHIIQFLQQFSIKYHSFSITLFNQYWAIIDVGSCDTFLAHHVLKIWQLIFNTKT